MEQTGSLNIGRDQTSKTKKQKILRLYLLKAKFSKKS